jgi:hypothetical protein
MQRDECLDAAKELVNGERATDYGSAYENHNRIASLWSRYLSSKTRVQVQLTPMDVAHMMILLKVARLMHSGTDDSYVDICGYAALAAEMDKEYAR